jgi:hypothetical protein
MCSHLLSFAIFLVFLASPFASASERCPGPQADDQVVVAEGTIAISAEGRVTRANLSTSDLPDALRPVLLERIETWTFAPASDARESSFFTELRRLKEDPSVLEFARVEFGWPLLSHAPTPVYPVRAALEGVGAELLVELQVDRRGRVVEAAALAGRILHQRIVDPTLQARMLGPFVRAARAAVRRWRFDHTPDLGPDATLTLYAPVRFELPEGRALAEPNTRVDLNPNELPGCTFEALLYGLPLDSETLLQQIPEGRVPQRIGGNMQPLGEISGAAIPPTRR